MENGGTGEAGSDTAEDWLNQNSVGTGPYVIDHWDAQVETVLVRNENYAGEAPYFDRIIFVNIPEAATQAVALESGEIDLAIDLTADQVADLEGNADLTVYRSPGNFTHFLLMNMDPELGGPVTDPNVQLAIRYALDYEGYRTLWPGSVTPGTTMWMGIQGAFQPDQAFERDLDRARELLTEAGYPDGFDITMSYPDLVFGGVDTNVNAQKIQADLAEVGINVELRPGEVGVSLEEYRTGQQGFAYWFWGPDILDPSDFLSFVPGGKVAAERANWTTDMADPELVALVDRASVATDPVEREALYAELQTAIQEGGIWAPFNLPPVQFAFAADMEGFVWHPQWQFDPTLLSRAE
jgi:peptide/nickel transport system substrate-binding protein